MRRAEPDHVTDELKSLNDVKRLEEALEQASSSLRPGNPEMSTSEGSGFQTPS